MTILKLAAAALAIVAAGCQTTPQDAGPRPSNLRALMKDYIKNNYFDPYSLRDVEIGEPELWEGRGGWVFCFKANGKNQMGAYTGLTTKVYMVRDGKIIDFVEGTGPDQFCSTRKTSPWVP